LRDGKQSDLLAPYLHGDFLTSLGTIAGILYLYAEELQRFTSVIEKVVCEKAAVSFFLDLVSCGYSSSRASLCHQEITESYRQEKIDKNDKPSEGIHQSTNLSNESYNQTDSIIGK